MLRPFHLMLVDLNRDALSNQLLLSEQGFLELG